MTIVVSISLGLCLFTYKFTEFNALGFSCLLFASLVSGLRWTFAQLIMQKSNLGLHNPIDMVYHMQPWMILSILPFTICFEGPSLYEGYALLTAADANCVWAVSAKIIGGSFIAFCMELSEFLVLSVTSSLTLAVTGIFKVSFFCQFFKFTYHWFHMLFAGNWSTGFGCRIEWRPIVGGERDRPCAVHGRYLQSRSAQIHHTG